MNGCGSDQPFHKNDATVRHTLWLVDDMEKVARVDNYTNNNAARTLSEGEPGSVLAGVDGALFFWLQQAHQALRVSLLQAFAHEGLRLSPEQFSVLNALWFRDGVSQAYLAQATSRDRPGISRLVESLERLGLINRTEDERDRRAHRITLAPKGREIHARMQPIVEEVLSHGLEGMDLAFKSQLRSGLRRIRVNFKGEPEEV